MVSAYTSNANFEIIINFIIFHIIHTSVYITLFLERFDFMSVFTLLRPFLISLRSTPLEIPQLEIQTDGHRVDRWMSEQAQPYSHGMS